MSFFSNLLPALPQNTWKLRHFNVKKVTKRLSAYVLRGNAFA